MHTIYKKSKISNEKPSGEPPSPEIEVEYFISFGFKEGTISYFGNVSLKRKKKIKSFSDIEDIRVLLEKEYNISRIIILNWRKFE